MVAARNRAVSDGEATIEELETYDTYAIVRCVNCTCINTAWVGGASFNRIFRERILRINYPCCSNHNCKCHTTGGTLQAKKIGTGLEAPF